jgi:protein arginine kinase
VELNELDRRGGEWLRGGGARAEVVLSSRVRLARNLAGFPFAQRANDEQKAEVVKRAKDPLSALPLATRAVWVDLEKSEKLDTRFLGERHLISRELESAKGPRGVVFGSDESVSVMVNEEDHLRIQAVRSSLALEEAFTAARAVDVALEGQMPYAVSKRYGYLTACPTNAGTGMRASVMLHLPALVHLKQIDKVFQAASRTGLAVRGFNGEGTPAVGDLYQISNQVTLGRSEEEILQDLKEMLPRMLEYEDKCRHELATRGRLKLEDKVHRALALLRSARTIASEEAMQHLSAVRLGVVLEVLPGIDLQRVNELFVLSQPAHLQKLEGRPLEAEERDVRRAAFLRSRLAA